MKKRILFATLLALFCYGSGTDVYAQDPVYFNGMNDRIDYNPAFAGLSGQGRLMLDYQRLFASVPGGFSNSSLSYDQPLFSFCSFSQGIGVNYTRTAFGEGLYAGDQLALNYALGMSLQNAGEIRLGLRGGVNFSRFVSASLPQLFSQNPGNVQSFSYDPNLDLGAGLLWYNQMFWAGISLDHLNNLGRGIYPGTTNGPKFQAQAGARLELAGKWTFIPNIAYVDQVGIRLVRPALDVERGRMTLTAGWHAYLPGENEIGMTRIGSAFLGGRYEIRNRVGISYAYGYRISTYSTQPSGGHHQIGLYFRIGKFRYHKDNPFRETDGLWDLVDLNFEGEE